MWTSRTRARRARMAHFDAIRHERPLTDAERAEQDRAYRQEELFQHRLPAIIRHAREKLAALETEAGIRT